MNDRTYMPSCDDPKAATTATPCAFCGKPMSAHHIPGWGCPSEPEKRRYNVEFLDNYSGEVTRTMWITATDKHSAARRALKLRGVDYMLAGIRTLHNASERFYTVELNDAPPRMRITVLQEPS